ncbi:mucin-associated surface protein (MASP) [Trypanosoma cruzi]|nr:mucin-associated surface protein (MASP) [Trypanosoma cruzi]
MAMMMTGRVLLVCALCVLWCGAAVEAAGDVSGIGDGTPPEPQKIEKSPEGTQGLRGEATDVNVKLSRESSPSLKEEVHDDEDDDDGSDDNEEETAKVKKEKIKGPTQAQEGKNNEGPSQLPPPPIPSGGPTT